MVHDVKLPASIVTRTDVGRLIREVQAIEGVVKQGKMRGNSGEKPFATSRLLDEISSENKLNLLHDEDRQILQDFLEQLRKAAPLLHFSFSTDPSPRFITSLLTWLRREIDPNLLLQIGLEPTLGVGCILRTTNRSFDFSLRHHFIDQHNLLVEKIKEGAT